MNRFQIENGWYGDFLSTGEYCCLIPDQFIHSYLGKINLPILDSNKPDNILFLTIHTNGGDLYISGQGHYTGHCWLYTLSKDKWNIVGTTFGTRPVAFFKDKLYVSLPINRIGVYDLKTLQQVETIVMNVGVNGIRIVQDDRQVVTGDSTYNGSLDPKINLAEYIPLSNGSYIGQSYTGGCVIAIPGETRDKDIRKIIEPGDCKFIRAYYSNGSYHVTIVKELEHTTAFLNFTDSDLVALPDETVLGNKPPSNPPSPMNVPNKSKELTQFKNQYGPFENNDDAKRKFIFAFASYLNYLDGSRRFGGKARASLNEPSKATLGYWIDNNIPNSPTDGKMHVFQLISSSGIVSWDTRAEFGDIDYNNIYGRFFPAESIPMPNPVPNQGPTPLEMRVQNLESQLKTLLANSIKYGDKIALQTESGYYVCAESSGASQSNVDASVGKAGNINATRTGIGSWETFTIKKV